MQNCHNVSLKILDPSAILQFLHGKGAQKSSYGPAAVYVSIWSEIFVVATSVALPDAV